MMMSFDLQVVVDAKGSFSVAVPLNVDVLVAQAVNAAGHVLGSVVVGASGNTANNVVIAAPITTQTSLQAMVLIVAAGCWIGAEPSADAGAPDGGSTPSSIALCVAIGFKRVNRARAEIYDQVKAAGYEMITYVSSKAIRVGKVTIGDNVRIHPQVVIESHASIGSGSEIFPGTYIGKEPRGAGNLARNPTFERRISIGRECVIGPSATIYLDVEIGDNVLVGDGASIREQCRIGEGIIRVLL